MNRKGQGAMEYLMTYGWAILVVIIVGIVLWQSGVFGTGSGGVSGFNEVRVEDYVFNSTGVFISVENAAGQTLRTVSANVSINGGASAAATLSSGVAGSWAPGKEYVISYADGATCSAAGAGYDVDVVVTYQSAANLAHTESGTIRGTCD